VVDPPTGDEQDHASSLGGSAHPDVMELSTSMRAKTHEALLCSCPRQDTHNMSTGLTWGVAAASDRGILHAQDGLDEEIAKTDN